MTIDIRSANDNDKVAWNNYVETHSDARPYHRYEWVQSIEQAYGHKNASQIALQNGRIVGIMPLCDMKIPLFGHKYCALPFCDLGYILANSPQLKEELLRKLLSLKNDTSATKIEYRDIDSSALPIQGDDHHEQKVVMLLPLPSSSEDLLNGFKSKLRSQIKKAEKNGLLFAIGNSSTLVNDFYEVYSNNMRKLGSPAHSKLWFETLAENYGENMYISVVYHLDTPIGAGIVLTNGKRACIPWASTLASFNSLAPNMLLYWSLLKQSTDAGMHEFDFGRSTYGEGTFRFKQQWGASPVRLNWSTPGTETSDDVISTSSGRTRAIVENIWSKLPLGVTVFMGSRVRKYISL